MNVTLEFAKLNNQLISQFTKMTTNNNLISILSAYVRPTELGGTCFYVSAETLSLESPLSRRKREKEERTSKNENTRLRRFSLTLSKNVFLRRDADGKGHICGNFRAAP